MTIKVFCDMCENNIPADANKYRVEVSNKQTSPMTNSKEYSDVCQSCVEAIHKLAKSRAIKEVAVDRAPTELFQALQTLVSAVETDKLLSETCAPFRTATETLDRYHGEDFTRQGRLP